MQPHYYRRKMKKEKLQLYTMDMKYIRDLHNADDKVQSVSPQIHKNNRPFVGVVVICEKHKYCIPLDHPKEKHYTMKNDSPPEKAYKILCSKELDWIQKIRILSLKKRTSFIEWPPPAT